MLKRAGAPFQIRTSTFKGLPFTVQQKNIEPTKNNLATKSYFLRANDQFKPKRLMSPWHEIQATSSTFQDHHITGIIEISQGATEKLEMCKETPMNPVA